MALLSQVYSYHFFDEIERNPATKGEYVLWPDGIPVSTVAAAVAVARERQLQASRSDAELADAEDA